jgi:hypothetical protein
MAGFRRIREMSANKTAEEEARDLIDEQLSRAGWFVCDRRGIDLINHQGVAVREVILDTGHGRCWPERSSRNLRWRWRSSPPSLSRLRHSQARDRRRCGR